MALGTYRPRNTGRYPFICPHCGYDQTYRTIAAAEEAGWWIVWEIPGRPGANRGKIQRTVCPRCADVLGLHAEKE